jgi:tol-pal system protein YbgF
MRSVVVRQAVAATALAFASLASVGAHAALFEDDEARRAILDLRQRVEAMREATNQRLTDENGQLRRSLLDLQSQIEAVRGDLARMTGQNEQLNRTLTELQQRQTEVDDRLKKSEPSALGVFRAGQFAQAQTAFAGFVKAHPQSGYNPSALFWLGNAQYATRNYNEAIANFRSMLSLAPDHAKAPEAVLSIANCQIELKDTRAARRTLEDLTKAYPQSEAAQAGRERLARLK